MSFLAARPTRGQPMNAPLATGVQGFLARFEGLRARLPGDPAPAPRRRRNLAHARPAGPARRSLALHQPAPDRRGRVPRAAQRGGRRRRAAGARAPSSARAWCSSTAASAPSCPARRPAPALAPFAATRQLRRAGAARPRPARRAEHHAGRRRRGHRPCRPTPMAERSMLVSLATAVPGRATAFHPRHRIRLGPGARLTLVEVALGEGTYLHNPVSEIDVAEGASLTHVRLQDEAPAAFHLATLYAAIAAGGTYDSFTLALGGRLARTEVHTELAGPGAAAHLNAAQLLTGVQHADFTTVVRHAAPRGTSRQTVKNVLAGRSRGVFQGQIEVARARAEDRRLPDEPGAAAVARRRDRQQAGAGNLRRRREVQPRRHGGRTRPRAAVLPAQPRHPRAEQRARCWCAPS